MSEFKKAIAKLREGLDKDDMEALDDMIGKSDRRDKLVDALQAQVDMLETEAVGLGESLRHVIYGDNADIENNQLAKMRLAMHETRVDGGH